MADRDAVFDQGDEPDAAEADRILAGLPDRRADNPRYDKTPAQGPVSGLGREHIARRQEVPPPLSFRVLPGVIEGLPSELVMTAAGDVVLRRPDPPARPVPNRADRRRRRRG